MDFDSIPDEAPAAAAQQTKPAAPINFDDIPDEAAKGQTSDLDFDKLPDETSKYSGFLQNTLGTAEQVGQGALGPFATAAESALSGAGVPGLTPKDIESRKQALGPVASTASEVAGVLGSAFAGPLKIIGAGSEALLASRGLYDAAALGMQKYGQNIFKAMAEMGYLGASEEANKQLKGENQPKTPEDAVARIYAAGGASALLAPVASVATTGIADVSSAALKKIASTSIGKKALDFVHDLGAVMHTGEAPLAGESAAAAAPEGVVSQAGVQNTSLSALQDRLNQAGGLPTAAPRSSVESAAARVAMDNPFHPMQLNSLDSKEAQESYQMAKERPDEIGKILRDTESLQKQELVGKTEDTIKDIAGTDKVTADKIEGGNQASDYFTKQYQAEKKEAGELVGQAKKLDTEGFDHLNGVVDSMSKAVPGIDNMIDRSGESLRVLPYKTSMGLSKQTYGAVKDAVASLESNPTKFSDLFNIRKGLENGVNMFTSDQATTSEIRSLKAAMMGYMQEMAPPNLREGFQRYAINEGQREVIEKAFGASVGNKEYGAISKITPETVIKDIFGDSASIQAARNILPKEQYSHLLGNWIAQTKAAATDAETGVFSSRKFASLLKANEPKLQAAFADNPQGLQRIKDLTTMMKVVPDAPPVSPATYDRSILDHLKGTKGISEKGLAILGYLKENAMRDIDKQKGIREINKVLAGGGNDPQKITGGIISALSKRIGRPIADHAIPITLKAMATNPEALADALDHADSMWKGNNLMQRQVNELFSGARIGASMYLNKTSYADKIKKYIENGTLNQEVQNSLNQSNNPRGFAHGGAVSQTEAPIINPGMTALSTIVPEQTMLMSMAKGRIANYLNSKRPIDSGPSFPFDESHTDPAKEKSYDRAIHIADKPLSVLNHIQKGTLEPEHIEHMKQMWPEMYGQLSSKITQKMMDSRVKKEKMPPYHVRQSLGMFLGSPLDSSMTPGAIQAAQSVFASQKAVAAAAPTKVKKGTSKLGEASKQLMTGPQAAESRQVSGKA